MTKKEDSRHTTEEIVQLAWENLRAREHARGREEVELPPVCPPNARMILEAADEIAQWRVLEGLASRKRRK